MSIAFAEIAPISITAFRLGPEAAALRFQCGGGHVIAVLSNALYLHSECGLVVSIVAGGIDGPLTLRVPQLGPLLVALEGFVGATFEATPDALLIAGRVSLTWSDAPLWSGDFPERVGSVSERLAAAGAVAESLRREGNRGGCGPVACYLMETWNGERTFTPLPTDALTSRILAWLNRARAAAQAGEYEEVASTLAGMLGLGLGLTPSGDDLLAGIVAALKWQARLGCVPPELVDPLVGKIREAAPVRTNHISARLLWHACEGVLYAPAMDLGGALLSGGLDGVQPALERLLSIGHTTGVDVAAGLLLGTLLVS